MMGSVSGRSLHPDVGQVSEHDTDAAGVALSGPTYASDLMWGQPLDADDKTELCITR